MRTRSSTKKWNGSKGYLSDVSDEILVDVLLPTWDITDIHHFGQTCKRYRALSQSTRLWRRLLRRDIGTAPSFLLDITTQPLLPQDIYRGLVAPRGFFHMSEELEKSPMIYKNGQMSPRSMKVLGKELDMPKDIGDKESDISEALDDDEHDVSEKSDDEDLDISEETEDKVDSNGTRTLSRHNVLTRIYASESDCIAISATGYVYYLVPSRQFLPPPLLFQSSLATKGARKTSNRSPSRPTWSYRLELPSLASQAALSPHNNLTVLDIKNRICSLDTYYRFRGISPVAHRNIGPLPSPNHGSRTRNIAGGVSHFYCLMDIGDISESSWDEDGTRVLPPIPPKDIYDAKPDISAITREPSLTKSQPLSSAKRHVVAIASCEGYNLALNDNGDVWGHVRSGFDGEAEKVDWKLLPDISGNGVTNITATDSIEYSEVTGREPNLVAVSWSSNGPIRSTTIDFDFDSDVQSDKPFQPRKTTMNVDERGIVDVGSNALYIFALLTTGELYTWPAIVEGESNVQYEFHRHAIRVVVDGDENLCVYSMSANARGVHVLTMPRSYEIRPPQAASQRRVLFEGKKYR